MIQDFLTELLGNQILAVTISSFLPLVFVLLFVLMAVYAERKVSAHMQDRLGPMRVGPHGILQTVADLLKMLQKEDTVAKDVDRPLFFLAPYILFAGSYAAFAVIPFSSAFIGSGLDLGILFIIASSGFVVAGIMMGGWASNNKYSLLGAMRSAAQIVSYEIPTLLVILALVIVAGTMNLSVISEQQTGHFWNWYIFGGPGLSWHKFVYFPLMVIGFMVLYISSLAEVNRTPFDIPEAESELVSGYHTEYSGMRWGIFMLTEYGNMYAVSAVVAALFFGGYQSPIGYLGNSIGVEWLVPVEQFIWFTIKGLALVFVQMWLRWTLPRLRVDQLMTVCWKYLIPIAFANLLIIGLIKVL